jgi:hypothetical protein
MCVAVFSIVACAGKDAPAAGADTAAGNAAAPASAPVSSAPATPAQIAADQHSMATYQLTLDHVTRLTEVTRTIQSLEKSDPALKTQWEKLSEASGPTTIDQVISRISVTPRAPEVLKTAGISAHDYVYTTFTLMYASAAYEMQKAGHPINSTKLATQVSPENVAFVAAHQKEIATLSAISSAGDSSDEN